MTTSQFLPYDPGSIPNLPTPLPGESIEFSVNGFPPSKDTSFSIRNPKHTKYMRFVILRAAAIEAMAGRAWSHGAIGLDLEIYAQILEPKLTLIDYLGGVMDSLDGSQGMHFTYLPIIFNDDCQVCDSNSRFNQSEEEKYTVRIRFLADNLMA